MVPNFSTCIGGGGGVPVQNWSTQHGEQLLSTCMDFAAASILNVVPSCLGWQPEESENGQSLSAIPGRIWRKF